jgi:hypothetical protein
MAVFRSVGVEQSASVTALWFDAAVGNWLYGGVGADESTVIGIRHHEDWEMIARAVILASIIMLFSACSKTIDEDPNDTQPRDVTSVFGRLWGRYPEGIPWQVDVIDSNGQNKGSFSLIITKRHENSCLGDISDGVRVEIPQRDAMASILSVTDYGVAKIIGSSIKIDLTGGICDGYVIMDGKLELDGSSTGEVYTLGETDRLDIGEYKAAPLNLGVRH